MRRKAQSELKLAQPAGGGRVKVNRGCAASSPTSSREVLEIRLGTNKKRSDTQSETRSRPRTRSAARRLNGSRRRAGTRAFKRKRARAGLTENSQTHRRGRRARVRRSSGARGRRAGNGQDGTAGSPAKASREVWMDKADDTGGKKMTHRRRRQLAAHGRRNPDGRRRVTSAGDGHQMDSR